MKVVDTVHVVNVQGVKTVVSQSADNLRGIVRAENGMTDVKAGDEEAGIERVAHLDEIFGTGADGIHDMTADGVSLPHIFNSNFDAEFLRVGLQGVI